MVDFQRTLRYSMEDYRKVVEILRSDEGCPWDRVQTHESIRGNLIEEALECAEAIDEKNTEHLIEELGDLLMQVMFHARIAEEQGEFSFDDVCDASCRKLVTRHPHVFGEKKAVTDAEALENWEAAKKLEHKQKSVYDSLNGVARTLPGTWRADKLIKKSGGWQWGKKLPEDISDAELGDTVFAAVFEARRRGLDIEKLISESCERYIGAYADEFENRK